MTIIIKQLLTVWDHFPLEFAVRQMNLTLTLGMEWTGSLLFGLCPQPWALWPHKFQSLTAYSFLCVFFFSWKSAFWFPRFASTSHHSTVLPFRILSFCFQSLLFSYQSTLMCPKDMSIISKSHFTTVRVGRCSKKAVTLQEVECCLRYTGSGAGSRALLACRGSVRVVKSQDPFIMVK